MEYRPYSSGVISLARIIVPSAMMRVDVDMPMNSCTLPFAEVLLISTIFCSIASISKCLVSGRLFRCFALVMCK